MKGLKTPVYLGLGSNVGRRAERLRRAVARLGRLPGTRLGRVSPVYESSPVGPRQRWFLNAVARIETTLDPLRLLLHLKGIERDLGRRRRRRWGPREIDVDILFYGRRRRKGRRLELPHPRWRERKFVLWPLADIAPRFRDPADGRTVAALRRKLTDPDQRIRLYKSGLL